MEQKVALRLLKKLEGIDMTCIKTRSLFSLKGEKKMLESLYRIPSRDFFNTKHTFLQFSTHNNS
jgi:hypothetical protein